MQEKQTLPALLKEAHAIEELLIETDGEMIPVLTEWMTINEQNMATKIDSYKYVFDKLESGCEFFKKKEEEMRNARKSYENYIQRLKENLKFTMESLTVSELKGHDYRFKLQRIKPKVVILNESVLSAEYIREKITLEVDKTAIKEAFDKGIEVVGATLEEGVSLRSYVNKKELT